MTDEELKKKCTERAKIFQKAMVSCHSSSPIDCIEWFADRIAELESENEQIKNSDTLCKLIGEQKIKIAELEAQIEKLIDFVLSKTECCDVCPITDTCINSEGTCPYAGILSKGEEEVTREWLMQFISKEIKEK